MEHAVIIRDGLERNMTIVAAHGKTKCVEVPGGRIGTLIAGWMDHLFIL